MDLMYLSMQGSSVPEQFGALLVLDPGDAAGSLDAGAAVTLLSDRILGVPRMRQRVMRVPPGCGRALWVDDGRFDVGEHVSRMTCPSPGDERALLDAAASLVLRRLPVDRPLWAATVVDGLVDGRLAVVLVVQHALLDGLGGLAVLGALVDGARALPPRPFPAPVPGRARLAADAWRARAHTLARGVRGAHPPRRATQTPQARGKRRTGRAARCSLLGPTGPSRRVTVVRVSVDAVRAAAHRHGVTVNDLVVTAVGGACGSWLRARGEHVPGVVAGIPVSERRTATAESPGNRFTQTRALVPTDGDPLRRLGEVSEIMTVSKGTAMPPAAGVVAAAVVRAVVRLGLHGWYMRHQHYLHTVVTDVHGPDRRLGFGGAPIIDVLPLAVGGGGNVTVSFAALSYVDSLAVTITADPGAMPDQDSVTAALQAELDALTAA